MRKDDLKFYLSVRELLPEWWEEFKSDLDESGKLKYRTVWQFALAKTKNRRQRELICEMIGPRPDRKRLRVPWQGDWEERRMGIHGGLPLPEELKTMTQTFRDNIAAVDAVRSAAPFVIAELSRCTRMSEEIDKSFAGQPLDPNKPPHCPKNRARFKAYTTMQSDLTPKKMELIDRWMTIHGMAPKDPPKVSHRNKRLRKKVSDPEGRVKGLGTDVPWREMELLKLAQALLAHEKNFGLPVPKEILGDITEAETLVHPKQNRETD